MTGRAGIEVAAGDRGLDSVTAGLPPATTWRDDERANTGQRIRSIRAGRIHMESAAVALGRSLCVVELFVS